MNLDKYLIELYSDELEKFIDVSKMLSNIIVRINNIQGNAIIPEISGNIINIEDLTEVKNILDKLSESKFNVVNMI